MMRSFQFIPATEDWCRYRKIFNRFTQYAPYTASLSENMINNHIVPFMNRNESLALIGSGDGGEGIIHVGEYNPENGKKNPMGFVYLLFADTTDLAQCLLERAEEWFKNKNLKTIRIGLTPYKYILHGAEAYIWGGAYPTINAFRRLNYDISCDVVVMTRKLVESCEYKMDLPELEIRDEDEMDNELVWAGALKVYSQGQLSGACYIKYLKAISENMNVGIGQVGISLNRELHGTGIAKKLLAYGHEMLYRRGARKVMLTTNQSLFRAIKFYEAIEYRAETIRAYRFTKDLQ